MKVRSLILSDIHLGSRYTRSKDLLELLENTQCEFLFLIGDIIEDPETKTYWDKSYTKIIKRILQMSDEGTTIIYTPGNHDAFARHFVPLEFHNVNVVNQYVHVTNDGRKVLLVHGDIFDAYTHDIKWLYKFGDNMYAFMLWFNKYYNKVREYFGWEYWSISLFMKQNLKRVMNYVNKFEEHMADYTRQCGCDTIVCGHIHIPIVKYLGDILYYNCGSWVEESTFCYEQEDGKILLVTDYEKFKNENRGC